MHLVTGIGPRLTAALLERFGSPSAVRAASAEELSEIPYLGGKVVDKLRAAWQNPDIDAECALLEEHGVAIHALGSTAYPAVLGTIPAPPQLLYVKGTLETRDE